MGGIQMLSVLVNVVRNKLTAEFIGSFGMGLADLYSRTADFISQGTSFGIGISAVRDLSELHERGDQRQCAHYVRLIRTLSLWLAALGMLVCVLAAPLLSRWSVGGSGITQGYWKLAPMVGFLTLTAGETAILRATRRLRTIAINTTTGAVITLAITAVLYPWLGRHGILPVMLCSTGALWLLNLRSTMQSYPLRLMRPRKEFFMQSRAIIKIGIALLGAGILGAGAEMVIRNFLVSHGSLEQAGFYAAGLTLTVTYVRLIFSAIDADYYPRLSALTHEVQQQNSTINRQIDVLVLLVAPSLILFALFLPLGIRILYTREFLLIEPMVLAALGYTFFKAVYTPIAYLPLAHGDSRIYFIMEMLYNVNFCALVMLGFTHWGLLGAGVALTVANALDLACLFVYYRHHYDYHMESRTLLAVITQGMLASSAIVCCLMAPMKIRLMVVPVIFILSATYSIYSYKRK